LGCFRAVLSIYVKGGEWKVVWDRVFKDYITALQDRLFPDETIDQIIEDINDDHQKRRFFMMYILQSKEVFQQYNSLKEELGLSHHFRVVVTSLFHGEKHGRAKQIITKIIQDLEISKDMVTDLVTLYEIKEFLKEFQLFVLYFMKRILNRDEITALIELYGGIKDELEVAKIILYGSKVRFEGQKYSDLDILILTNAKVTKEKREFLSEVSAQVGIKYGVGFDCKIYNVEQWESGEGINPFFKENVDKDGVEWELFTRLYC
jgi:predicted nucleotidyltransferase